MTQLIPFRPDVEFEIFISDIKNLDFENSLTGSAKKSFESIRIICTAFAEDLLSLQEDRKVKLEFYFYGVDFQMTFSHSFPHFHKHVTFNFKYEYNDYFPHYGDNTFKHQHEYVALHVQKIINSAIEGTKKDSSAIKPPDIEESSKFFKNLSIIESALGFDGKLLAHLKANPFKSTIGFVKDRFDIFDLEKQMKGSPLLIMKTSIYKIEIHSDKIVLNFKGITVEFKSDIMMPQKQIVVIKEMLISLFNTTTDIPIKDIEEFKMMVGLLSI